MKKFLILLCVQSCLIGVLSVFHRIGDANAGELANSTLKVRPAEEACSVYSNMPASRIFGGDIAAAGEFPWMAALGFIHDHETRIFFGCGGTIISQHFVLTAASCTRQYRPPVLVRLGKLTLSDNDNDGVRAVNYQVKEVILHPDRSSHKKTNDIALIRLIKPIIFTNYISPACLNTNKDDLGDLIVTGWGDTDPDLRSPSNDLLKIQLKTVPLLECNSTYLDFNRVADLAPFRNGLNEGQYCAYDPERKKDSCNGDGGDPLQYFPTNKSTTAIIVGIVSFGVSCGTSLPSIHTRVAHYLEWIEPIVWPTEE